MTIDPGAATPLYQQVAAHLREQIVSGALPVGARLAPHRELAVEYGVSLITINKALAGLVSEGVLHSRVGRGTFVAVRPAPAPAAGRGTAGGAPDGRPMLGFVLRDLTSPFFSLIAHAAQQRADAVGCALLFASSSNSPDREDEQVRRFLDLGVQGLVVASMSRTYVLGEQMQALHADGFPYVMVSYTEGEDVPFVGLDLEAAGAVAARHLYAVGRRRPGYLADRFGSPSSVLRSAGYRRVFAGHGVAIDPAFEFEYAHRGEWNDYDSGFLVGAHLAGLAERPDAMYCFNDLGALGLIDGLTERGVRVPEDVSVVGLDDIALAQRAPVPLTTVRQPVDRIGAMAVDTLLARLGGGHPPARRLLEPALVIRRSCGAPLPAAPPGPPRGGAPRPARPPRSLAERRAGVR